MKKIILAFTFLISLNAITAQEITLKGKVTSKQTKKVLAFTAVTVHNAETNTFINYGYTDENGNYSISFKKVPFFIKAELLGYKDYKSEKVEPTKTTIIKNIFLEEDAAELDEVVISHKYENRIFKIQPYSKKDLYGGFGISKKPWQIGLYFPYDSAYYKTEYIQKIAILLNKGLGYKRKVSKFRVRLFSVTQDSLPDKDLIKENIIVTALKKQKEVNINLAAYNIVFPKNGVYVMFEGLAIPFNEVERSYTMTGIDGKKSKVKKETAYVPNFKAFLGESGKFLVVHYSDGKWFKFPVPHDKGKKYFVPAISLTLSN